MELKVLGHVDLETGKVYNNEGKDITPEPMTMKDFQKYLDDTNERLERRRAWLAGEFSYLP